MNRFIKLFLTTSLLLGILVLLNSCFQEELLRVTTISTGVIEDPTSTSAKATGQFGDVSGNVTEFGHCWGTNENPEISDNKFIATGTSQKAGEIISNLSNLTANTLYYVRAYAIDNGIAVYGKGISFTTSASTAPTISTNAISLITHESANSGGNITDDGGQSITERGVCWASSENPSISDNKTSDGAGIGEFTSSISGLSGNTTYYVRAYASTATTTTYGNQQSFTTTEAKYITITSPSLTSNWSGGNSYFITWDDNIDENVSIQLLNGNSVLLDIVASPGVLSNGSHNWDLPNTINSGVNYKIKITSADNAEIADTSIAFEIAKPPTDFNSNTYKIIKIGDQWWMAENLRSTNYFDGAAIPNEIVDANWLLLNNTAKAYCFYTNNTSLGEPYGALYTWAGAMNGSTTESVQGVCPAGWHLPSDEEWKTLEKFLGMSEADANSTNWRGSQGSTLKDDTPDYWTTGNTGTNASGFTAVGSGYRSGADGSFYSFKDYTQFWTSTFFGSNEAWYRELRYDEIGIRREHYNRNYGRSIRCVRD